MNIDSKLKCLLRSKYAKIITVLLLLSLTTTAFATVYVFYYANTTSTIKGSDVTLAAGPDASGSCSVYPCATVAISGTSDTATVTMSMFKADATFTPPPSSYYSNLIQVKDATNTHSIKSVQILSISDISSSDFGSITVYYCTAQTEFTASGALATPTDCGPATTGTTGAYYFAITSTAGGSVKDINSTNPLSITASSTQYIELVAYAGSSGTVGDTITFKIAVQWV